MGIIFGLLAAACYGAADFCGGMAAKRTSVFAVVVASQAVGLVLLAALIPFWRVAPNVTALESGFAAGVCGGVGLALLYYALSVGTMGVVSPLTAVLAASLPVLVSLLRGEPLALGQIAGIGLALGAIVLISSSAGERGHTNTRASVFAAIASGLLLGGFYVFLGSNGERAGFFSLLAARCGSVGMLVVLALCMRRSLLPAPPARSLVLAAGVIDVSANALYVLAASAAPLAVAAVLTSLYPASTVILAGAILRERLRPVQLAGIVLAFAGIVLIAL